ncbi:cytochrome c peroxidase [Rhizobiales bacterium GAS191]|nr:cytochrome c peroxidase [Rhizobiales bacterium GAS191]
MRWKLGGFLMATMTVSALLSLWWQAPGAQAVPRETAVWQDEYRRPKEIPFPDSNPYSTEKAALGRMLFFDPIFSASRFISCASCHNPGLSWGDGRARAQGEGPSAMDLRSPTLLNDAWMPRLGWDGKFRDIEAVTFAPITKAANMNLPEEMLLARLAAIPGYVSAFASVFGKEGITRRTIKLALATYERTIVSQDAPFDRWIEGEANAIGPAAKRGFELFNGKARCAGCHGGWPFSDGSFHDIGTARGQDVGRGRIFPSSVKLRYAFKTPTLRDIARRAPYMHDGSVATLADVIDLYDRGGIDRPSRSELISPLGLSEVEKADLIAFLETLSSVPLNVEVPTLPR